MPKAAPGSRVSASLRSAGAEGVGEGGFEEGQTEGGAALEAVTELDGKFEGWHLQAKQDAADAKAESAAGQAAVQKEISALTALVHRSLKCVRSITNHDHCSLAWYNTTHTGRGRYGLDAVVTGGW